MSVAGAIGVGALACAILVANNLRDIPTDSETGKRTLAVVLGDRRTRWLYSGLVMLAFVLVVAWCATLTPWALLAWLGIPLAARSVAAVRSGATGPALIPVLKDTGRGRAGLRDRADGRAVHRPGVNVPVRVSSDSCWR